MRTGNVVEFERDPDDPDTKVCVIERLRGVRCERVSLRLR